MVHYFLGNIIPKWPLCNTRSLETQLAGGGIRTENGDPLPISGGIFPRLYILRTESSLYGLRYVRFPAYASHICKNSSRV